MSSPDLGQIALQQTRAHGLWGRTDSPPDWQQALNGANAGDPILVKDPNDRRDDFYLIPFHPAKTSIRTAYVMLDAATLKLREASLLDHWPHLTYPDQRDCQRASEEALVLADGTVAKFRPQDFRANRKNLVWQASAASILPYWPVRELIVPHPQTGEPTSVYVTQKGDVYAQLLPDELPTVSKLPGKGINKGIKTLCGLGAVAAAAAALMVWMPQTRVTAPSPPDACQPPEPIAVTTVTVNGAMVSWPRVPGALSYKVELLPQDAKHWVTANASVKGTRFQLQELVEASNYVVRVSTNCAADTSPPSPETEFATLQITTPSTEHTTLQDAIDAVKNAHLDPRSGKLGPLRGLLTELGKTRDQGAQAKIVQKIKRLISASDPNENRPPTDSVEPKPDHPLPVPSAPTPLGPDGNPGPAPADPAPPPPPTKPVPIPRRGFLSREP